MQIKTIKTEQDYEVALRSVAAMFDNEPPADTPEGDFFEIMCVLINEYEKKTRSYRSARPGRSY